MNRIVHDFWLARGTVLAVGFILLAVVLIFSVLIQYQRRGYQHTSDAALARAIEEIRHEVRSLRAADADTKAAQQQIKREVQEVKEAVER